MLEEVFKRKCPKTS